MGKTFKFLGAFFLTLIFLFYISFVLIVPFAVQPLKYKADIQKIINDSSGLDFDFEKANIVTTPMLSIGLIAKNVDVSMPENKKIFHTDNLGVRISLPSLLFKTIKITYAKLDNPTVNFDINKSGTNYELLEYFEKFNKENQNNQENKDFTQESVTTNDFNFKLKINKFNIKNYSLRIFDNKNNHRLSLSGENFNLKFNGKTFFVKLNPVIKYDDNSMITSNIDLTSFLPEIKQQNNNEQTTSAEFFNPVEIFGKYNIKSNINSKLSIEQNEKSPKIKGFLYVTDTIMNISGINLPSSYVKLDFGGYNMNIDTNLCLSESEKAKILGSVRFDNNFNTDIAIKTDKIYLSNVLKLTKAVLSSLNIKNQLNTISADGFFEADMKLKTDLKDIKSSGLVKVAHGLIRDTSTGLLVNNIKANILLKDNNIKIEDTEASINGTPFIAEGNINEKSEADIKIYTKNLQLAKLFLTFAPADVKKQFEIKNGVVSLDILLQGKLESIAPNIKSEIINLVVRDKIDGIDITNGSCSIDLDTDLKTYNGKILNKNLVISLPEMYTTVRNTQTKVSFNEKDIKISPTDFIINGVSTFNLNGQVNNYIKKPEILITGSGSIRSKDIKNLAGKDCEPFIKSSGIIPVKLKIFGDDKKQTLIVRAFGSANEYVTPVDISELVGKSSTLQIFAELANNKINLKQTGLYQGSFSDLSKDISSSALASVGGSISLDKNITINNLKIATNGSKKLSLYAFNGSSLNGNTDITVTGNINNPVLRGVLKADNVNIPQLHTKLKNANISLNGDTFNINLNDLDLNGTSVNVNSNGLLDYKPIITLNDFTINSDDLNADKAVQVTEYMAKVPALNSNSSAAASLPVKIRSGALNIKKLKSGDIIAENITSKMTLNNDVVYLNDLKADAFDGKFNGNVSMNLITGAIKANVSGSGMNADKTVTSCAGMKKTIFGTLGFNADISLKGNTYEEQMRTLNGKADFNIVKGQFGTLGKFETFLKADNLASISFISTKIGSVVNTVSPHNTAEFEKLNGNVTFKNGLMSISSISSTGKNMSLYITGNMNLVNNNANMLVLGRISENIAGLLGPLEQLNPVRLLKKSSSTWAVVTVGILNALNEKSTPAEINKIPQLTPAPSADNTSKFVVKINGNIEKPQSAIKSFKWLSSETELSDAQQALSPKDIVQNVVKTIPTTKEEAINTLKETGKNTLLNIGKQLLNTTNEETENKNDVSN